MPEGMRGPRPSEIVSKLTNLIPEKSEKDIRNNMISGVRGRAAFQDREPTVTDYKLAMKSLEEGLQESPGLLRELMLDGFTELEYKRLLGADKYMFVTKVFSENLKSNKVGPLMEEYMRTHTGEDYNSSEIVFTMQDGVREVTEQVVKEAFFTPEITAAIGDDVLQEEMCGFIAEKTANMVARSFGISIDKSVTEEENTEPIKNSR